MAAKSNSRDTFYKWMTTIGCFLLLLPFSQTFYWGNLYIYCKSYMSKHTGLSPIDQSPWLLNLKVATTGVTSLLSGFLMRRTGKRPLLACGIALTSASHFLTYLAIQKSNLCMVLSFGVLLGLADGFMYGAGIQIVVDWAGSKDGTYIGIVRTGSCVGAIISNYFITWYINPENKIPDQREGSVVYFSQEDILDKVPSTFIILGTFCTLSQIAGFLLVRIKQSSAQEEISVDFETKETYGEDTSIRQTVDRNGDSGLQNYQSVISPTGISLPPLLPGEQPVSLPRPRQVQSPENEYAKEPVDMTPRQIIVTPSFYALSFTFITTVITYITVNNYYKEFGQFWISDDFFLTGVGTVIPIITIVFSILWGVLLDRLGVKNFLILFNVCLSLIGCLYSFTPRVSVWMFSICTVVYGAMVCPLYSINNGATAKMFGKSHFGANQGIIYFPSIVVTLSTPPVWNSIILNYGWNYFFLTAAFINVIGLVVLTATNFGKK